MKTTKPTAIITGGTRGIGLGIAKHLAQEGWNLVLFGRSPQESVESPLKELQGMGAELLYVSGDICQEKDRENLVTRAWEHFGSIQALVNNAGQAPAQRTDLLEAKEKDFEQLLRINLQAPYFLTQRVAKGMISSQRDGRNHHLPPVILFITSVSTNHASVNRGDYCVSKAGLSMTAQLWATRLAEFGILVYEIRPGVIATQMTQGVQEKYDALFENGLALQNRWGQPEDLGRAAASLLRGDWSYSTGQVFTVDGGLSVPRF